MVSNALDEPAPLGPADPDGSPASAHAAPSTPTCTVPSVGKQSDTMGGTTHEAPTVTADAQPIARARRALSAGRRRASHKQRRARAAVGQLGSAGDVWARACIPT
eukprot:2976693-Prymnesium_polylepis.1